MSSFLNDGKILIRCANRFMIFEENGTFIDEVEFNDDILDEISEREDSVHDSRSASKKGPLTGNFNLMTP